LPSIGPDAFLLKIPITSTYTFLLSKAQLIAVSMIVVLTFVNTLGIQEGKWIQRIFTLAKLLALFSLILGGLYLIFFGDFGNVKNYFSDNFSHGFSAENFVFNSKDSHLVSEGHWTAIGGIGLMLAFSAAMVGSLFSSDAWQGITFMSNEIEKPSKNIPKALFFGTSLVTIVYVLANLAYMALLPLKGVNVDPSQNHGSEVFINGISHASNERVGAAAASAFMGVSQNADAGTLGMYFMAALIMVSTFGCNNGLILAGSRLYKAMADQGLFFKKASSLNRKNVPQNALWMQCAWASILCLTGSYGDLLNYCTFASLLFYIITVVGLIILRKKEPNAERPYKVWGYPFVPVTYIILASIVAVGILWSQWDIAINGLMIVALGYPIYFLFNRKKNVVS
jgi:APA family basic amino acid/polyamine antiporter